MLFLVPLGWNEEPWTYVCLFVGFVYVFVSSVCLFLKSVPLYMVTSKKWISVGEHSPVSELHGGVDCVASLYWNVWNSVWSPDHKIRMSSMYLSQFDFV